MPISIGWLIWWHDLVAMQNKNNLPNAAQVLGAFLQGNKRLKNDKQFAQEIESLGTSFLSDYQSKQIATYVQLGEVLTELANLQLPEVATNHPAALVGILVMANIDVADNDSLLDQYYTAGLRYSDALDGSNSFGR